MPFLLIIASVAGVTAAAADLFSHGLDPFRAVMNYFSTAFFVLSAAAVLAAVRAVLPNGRMRS